ncbi:sialoadhesin-like [Sardina pilchardus]|uniref:sialoadhesin-like n=1 Tax=Sardina pilchardus TaxID=27697 RepID=UPI002E122AC9
MPERVEALEGFCVLIPCTFKILYLNNQFDTAGLVSAAWLEDVTEGKATGKTVFNNANNATNGFDRIEISGNLRLKNCTTVFYNVSVKNTKQYHFRAEISSFKATFLKRPFNLFVNAYPLNPRISKLSEVSEGTSVTLTCSAAAPCPSQPPTITWSPPTGNTHTHIQDEENGNRSLTSVLTFTASRSQNGRNISCTASYLRHNKSPLQNSTVQTLRVRFSPADVVASVSPSGPAVEGSSVTLTCNSSEANPPVQNYTWFRKDQNTPIGSGQTLAFNLSSSDEGLYYCRAEHPQGGKKSAAVRLEIKGHFPLPLVVGVCVGGPLLCVLIWLALRLIKSKTPPQDEQCTQDSGVCTVESVLTSASKPSEDLQDQILYGEIDFSKRPLRGSSKRTGQMQGQEQESVYAEVHLSGTDAQARYQEAPDTEDLYAQVKRK